MAGQRGYAEAMEREQRAVPGDAGVRWAKTAPNHATGSFVRWKESRDDPLSPRVRPGGSVKVISKSVVIEPPKDPALTSSMVDGSEPVSSKSASKPTDWEVWKGGRPLKGGDHVTPVGRADLAKILNRLTHPRNAPVEVRTRGGSASGYADGFVCWRCI